MTGPQPAPQADVGARLRRLRNERGLSLADVARATGLSASSLSLAETGKSDIAFGRLKRLIDFYGIRFSDLVPEPPPADPTVVRAASGAGSRPWRRASRCSCSRTRPGA